MIKTETFFQLESDISHECPFERVVRLAAADGVATQLMESYGPGGGNPRYWFTARTREALELFIREANPSGDPDYMISLIKEVQL